MDKEQWSMPTITMNSKTNCPWCDVSRAWLEGHQIPYVEVKLDDPSDRAALYDRLGLTGSARSVPQFVLTAEGEDYLISGSKELMQTGFESLFGKLPVTAVIPATSISVGADAVGVEAIEPTCESCE